jgi:ABC-type transport system substrate-binding protein
MDFPDPHAVLYRLFYSGSAGNIFGYRNPEVDRLLLEAKASLEEKQRAHLYTQIEQIILNDYAVVPLFSVNYAVVRRRRVHGFEITPLGFQYLPLRKVWIQSDLVGQGR